MNMLERGPSMCVDTDDLPWRPSAFASGVFVKDIATTDGWEMQVVRFEPGARFPIHRHERPEFVFILQGELVQAGQRLLPLEFDDRTGRRHMNTCSIAAHTPTCRSPISWRSSRASIRDWSSAARASRRRGFREEAR